MAANLSIYHAAVLTIAGVPFADVGTLRTPVKGEAAALDSGTDPILRKITIPAGEAKTIWQWSDTKGLAYAAIFPAHATGVAAAGFIQVGGRYNAPTSTTDLTPTGSINHWKEVSKSCVGAFEIDTERGYIHATAANEVAQSGSGTYPGVWDEVSRVLGVCDAIAVLNEGDDDVDIWFFLASK